MKVNVELAAAIQKHGPIRIPEKYETVFENAILEKRVKIAEEQIEKYRPSAVQEQK